jgi:hypothetical protein
MNKKYRVGNIKDENIVKTYYKNETAYIKYYFGNTHKIIECNLTEEIKDLIILHSVLSKKYIHSDSRKFVKEIARLLYKDLPLKLFHTMWSGSSDDEIIMDILNNIDRYIIYLAKLNEGIIEKYVDSNMNTQTTNGTKRNANNNLITGSTRNYFPNFIYDDTIFKDFRDILDTGIKQESAFDKLVLLYPSKIREDRFQSFIRRFREWRDNKGK